MFGPFTHINLIRKILKLLNNLKNIRKTDISNGKHLFCNFLWYSNGPETQKGNQPLYRCTKLIFWLWRCDFNPEQTTNIQKYVQGDVLLTIIDIPVFTKNVKTTILNVHRCELSLPECLPSVARMIIIPWFTTDRNFMFIAHVNQITSFWYYFLYLSGFQLTVFSSRKLQFSMLFCVSNLIQTFQTDSDEYSNQYSLVI